MTIVRAHHPLRGRRYDLLKSAEQRLTIRLENGTPMYIPRSWTDVDGPAAPCGSEIYTTESLRLLMSLVDAYLQR